MQKRLFFLTLWIDVKPMIDQPKFDTIDFDSHIYDNISNTFTMPCLKHITLANRLSTQYPERQCYLS